MHEFLLDFKEWQLNKVKPQMVALRQKESQCLTQCKTLKNDSQITKCENNCIQPRSAVEKFMYQKQSQFVQMINRSCIQQPGQEEVDPDKCYNDFKENMELVQNQIEEKIKETTSNLS